MWVLAKNKIVRGQLVFFAVFIAFAGDLAVADLGFQVDGLTKYSFLAVLCFFVIRQTPILEKYLFVLHIPIPLRSRSYSLRTANNLPYNLLIQNPYSDEPSNVPAVQS